MPLTIVSDKPNTNAATNEDHYNLAVMMMATGVPKLASDADRQLLLARMLLLDMANTERHSITEIAEWIDSFGTVSTNASKRTDAEIAKVAKSAQIEKAKYAFERSRLIADATK